MASAKWKEVNRKPDKINELKLKTKADLKKINELKLKAKAVLKKINELKLKTKADLKERPDNI